MKNKNYNIEQEVKKTMESIDEIKRVEGNPFLYTRLQERMNRQEESKVVTRHSRFPIWQLAMVAALLFINGFVLHQSGYFDLEKTVAVEETTIEDFADEYALTESEEDLDYLSFND